VELKPPTTPLVQVDTHRLIPSRYAPVGILDAVSSPEDVEMIIELEGWTNDRISAELGVVQRIPPSEWVLGRPQASVILAAFCHPRTGGGRFNDHSRGAWYAGFALETAHAECVFHRTAELEEVGVLETRVQMRQYLADFAADFHDVRGDNPSFAKLHDPASYEASQDLGRELLASGSNGIIYRSVRHSGGECLACFRPRLVSNVRQAAHFEYRWEGRREPTIQELTLDPGR
jgi:RES domain